MNDQKLTTDRLRDLARQLFLSAFPTSAEWFDLAWETASTRELDYIASSTVLADALHASDTTNPVVKEMAREFAVLFEAFMQKFPITQEALIERLDASCLKYGKNPIAARRLKEKLERNLKQEPPFVVWMAAADQLRIVTEYVSQEEAEAYIAEQNNFDIFINGNMVSVKGEKERQALDLPPRLYWLLIMFLRHRPHPLPPIESYRKAWDVLNPQPTDTAKFILQNYLRFAIADLRDKLEPFLSKYKFHIPGKPRDDTGYRCEGHCSFCIILDRDMELRATLKTI